MPSWYNAWPSKLDHFFVVRILYKRHVGHTLERKYFWYVTTISIWSTCLFVCLLVYMLVRLFPYLDSLYLFSLLVSKINC